MTTPVRGMLLFLVVCVAGVVVPATGCGLPPHQWCSSRENAVKCKVVEQCQQYVWTPRTSVTAAKVRVDLYFESLCPFCRSFMSTQLYPAYQKLKDIMEVGLYPYGNAKEVKSGDGYEYTCQHGPEECVGNVIETCAIALLRDFDKYFDFINCMESTEGNDPASSAAKCAQTQKVDIDAIMKCANSSAGNELEHKIATTTEALNPPHKFVPWIVVNGVHTDSLQKMAQTQLVKVVCDYYEGPKPEACVMPGNPENVSIRD